jgi:steroid delta-isomerase-like uncharacterized protein
VRELLGEGYVNHSTGSAGQDRGREGVIEVVRALRGAFPDLRYEIEDLVVGEQAVAVRTTMSGTHRGNYFGVAATGRAVSVSQICIEHFRDGKIVAHHRVTDELSLWRQLGQIP